MLQQHIMAPISTGIALELGYAIEPFLMVVAVGASCAFLTPIGHQCNTVVMGPKTINLQTIGD